MVATDDRPVCRSRSVLKRTTSVPANTFNAIVRSTTKGARSFAPKPKRPCSVSSYRLTPPSILKKTSTRLTTFLTAMSTVSTARVVSQNVDILRLSATTRGGLSKVLSSSCTSVMAVCSGMAGGLSRYSGCLPDNGGDPSQVPDSRVDGVVTSQQGPGWTMFIKRWITWRTWLSAGGGEVSDGERFEEMKLRKEASPWLTVFQVSIIIMLTASLCRNVERIWDL